MKKEDRMPDIVYPSWEVFDECDTCCTGPKQPCYNLKKSTSKNLIPSTVPHPGRKRLIWKP
jgi:hypothetical protein